MINNSHNKRVGCPVSWCFLPEPSGSGVWLFVLRRNPSDSAACAKHYTLENEKIDRG